ncbi:MAG: alpha/beta hydrolase [Desulfomonilaceae bacterium]
MPKTARTAAVWTALILLSVCLASCEKQGTKGAAQNGRDKVRENGVVRLEGSRPAASPAHTPPARDEKTSPEQAQAEKPQDSLKKLRIEKISGYKVPAEYFILSSKRFLDAVAAVTLPADYFSKVDKTYPMVIVFGGAGESIRPPRSGALAWMHYYKMDDAIQSLQRSKLEAADFQGLVTPSELAHFNRELQQHPYRGMIVVCPYSPPLSLGRAMDHPDYEAHLIQELLPALIDHYRVSPGKIGIDGVSNGGARSMYYGFKYPHLFAAIGSVQGSFGPFMDLYEELIQKHADVLKKKAIQLITSDRDSMRLSVQHMHELLKRYNIPHRYLQMTGPHDYVFNQGPGSLGLLVFHDATLHGGSPDKSAP